MARIAIIGAGPSGSAAGWHLALRGHEVLLLDRADFPRDKVCGDWLTPMALAELARLGLDAAALDGRLAEPVMIRQTELVAPSGARSLWALETPGRCIPRMQLDGWIRDQAVAAGCRFERRNVRQIDRHAPEWQDFDHLIDARGASAGPTNAVGLRSYWTVPRQSALAERAGRVALITDRQQSRGYGWIFPVEASADTLRFNVGIGLWKGRELQTASATAFFERFIASHPVAREIAAQALAGDQGTGKRAGFPLNLGSTRAQVVREGVLLIGDAAGLADPLTGDGIGNALCSGRLLAQVIDQAQGTDSADSLAARWQAGFAAHFQPEFRRAEWLRTLLTPGIAKELTARVLQRGPRGLRAAVHRTLFGQAPYRALF